MPHQKISLSWDSTKEEFTATSDLEKANLEPLVPPKPHESQPGGVGAQAAPIHMSSIQVHPGDTLEWSYPTGGITDFVIHLTPEDAFKPAIYCMGDNPVEVVKPFGKNGHAYCGFVSGGKLYGYPKNNKYGHSTPDGN